MVWKFLGDRVWLPLKGCLTIDPVSVKWLPWELEVLVAPTEWIGSGISFSTSFLSGAEDWESGGDGRDHPLACRAPQAAGGILQPRDDWRKHCVSYQQQEWKPSLWECAVLKQFHMLVCQSSLWHLMDPLHGKVLRTLKRNGDWAHTISGPKLNGSPLAYC